MKTSIIVGMGIGQLYAKVLSKQGYRVISVDSDPAKSAQYTHLDDAISAEGPFETAHICTPNFTHEEIARKLADVSKIVFIEKPGLKTAKQWSQLQEDYPRTKFLLVKNNMWRANISELKSLAQQSRHVEIVWNRKNCIPHPGSWFTTKSLAWGGVSRDLMPHLLSLFIALNDNWYDLYPNRVSSTRQQWQLSDITDTEYGVVNKQGTYNVDDVCAIEFDKKWGLHATWRNLQIDDSSIKFHLHDAKTITVDLGWCPEDAYARMISDAVLNIDNQQFWVYQNKIDQWIHTRLEELQ